ncbi:Inner membrane protein YrbG, predicted calcium/sodium:proton antiporter [Thioalkalivibrio nitratireducens DSM 14787]|uniref:Inner membrane protein YrbG, predicted calcium/sodium:proton antiporter n=1 Tax=Thioalkalivibrio nitratireducens (strain DSM 14787 / UNIQEM 213 / ALEN2) TaxID=1255043 RepID=L0DZ50_THIND|nr:calcium/sodium antiporter [Thioalkalivibrio nitratireducens]AGA34277.1 Inner membrane protein YrbG, predicted calcium/sodium:proton antiporter [Thioalkalivibrio nitratireducens DSM 14787]
MWLPVLAVTAGLAALTVGADRLVLGASALARGLGVTPLLIGLTIVAFGTSAPEVVVSIVAALQGNPDLAVGNAIGSNIANIGLVLGATALIAPLVVASGILRREFPILLGATLLGLVLLLDGSLDRLDGLILLAGLAALTVWLVVQSLRGRGHPDRLGVDVEAAMPARMGLDRAVTWLAVGLVLLLAGSRILVWGGVELAGALGVSDLVIGLTIVAIGTSLPELATSVVAARKGETDLAIGNVIGSNLFNLLCVLAIPGLLAPSAVEMSVLMRDYPVMLAMTVLLLLLAAGLRGPHRVQRWEGALLLGLFAGYLILIGWSAAA